MATNEEDNMGISTEPEYTVPLENNRVTAETGEITGTGGTSNADLLEEIQEMRAELIAATEEVKKNQKDTLQELESKIEDIKKVMSEKLQSIEALNSKMSSDIPQKSDNTTNGASEKKFKLKHVFENVSEFEENVKNISGKENHFNVNWYIMSRRLNGHLGCFIFCEPIAPSDKWSIRTKLEYKVVGSLQHAVIRTSEHCYQKSTGWGYAKFLEWEEVKKWYLLDGNLTVEAKVTIIETTGLGTKKIRTFDESQKDVSDVILVVGDTKFYVLKMFLASQSSVFKTLLFGDFKESEQSEVKLNGIDPEYFHYFLEVLYGESAIDEANVEDITLLADMYDAQTAIRRCEEFLLKESKKTLEKKLEIATLYNLENLKEKCKSEIEAVQNAVPKDCDHQATVVPKDSKVSKKNPLRKLLCF
ncbi:hypothetical protein B9Z55_007698 [Caenorhabditis nigoni]|uniref:BTB domain-containing protein n=1 Tax=Caenorhabditis nigoni TaxID=1611254 RepID=A0A2G5VAS7_9PELO|nr:hypothetical protein B9Z55_007698 [Caenorhabditis nigoni]